MAKSANANIDVSSALLYEQNTTHPAFKIDALTRYLCSTGISADAILEATDLTLCDLGNKETQVTFSQLFQVWGNVLRLCPNQAVALRAGQTIITSNYGFYGYVLLCASSLRKGIESAIRYHCLVMPTTSMHLEQSGDNTHFSFEDILGIKEFYRFNLELQASLVYSILKDAVGPTFKIDALHLSYPAPGYKNEYEEFFGCPITFGMPKTQMLFSSDFLDQELPHSNAITEAIVIERCENLLQERTGKKTLADKIYDLISENPGNIPSNEVVASNFAMTSRTLRRKLLACGSSYQAIADRVRKECAINLLLNTDLNIEKIAAKVGFNDAANFRNAFKRWTNKTPGEYRN